MKSTRLEAFPFAVSLNSYQPPPCKSKYSPQLPVLNKRTLGHVLVVRGQAEQHGEIYEFLIKLS
jgi:hypothetical protein